MSFKKLLFENDGGYEFPIIFIIILILSIGYLANTKKDFDPPGSNTETHYYTTQRPDPNRKIKYFDNKLDKWVYYDDEIETLSIKRHYRMNNGMSSRERELNKVIDNIKEDIKEEILMERD